MKEHILPQFNMNNKEFLALLNIKLKITYLQAQRR